MQFSSRDLTNQYISSSYQDVVQQYVPTGSTIYLLDGYGNAILGIPSESYGQTALTQDQTASYAISASWASQAAFATVSDVSLLADTASVSIHSETSSYFNGDSIVVSSLTNGDSNISLGNFSHAEGVGTEATGTWSHTEGNATVTIGDYSHAEGQQTTAGGSASHAEGVFSITIGNGAHAEGFGTIAAADHQHAEGQYNIISTNENDLLIIGNGTDDFNRSNILVVNTSSLLVNGNISASIVYSDVSGTASWAQSASWAPASLSSSWSDFARSSSWAQSASWAPLAPTDVAVSASWASASLSSSFSDFSTSSSFVVSASYADFVKSASYADFSKSSSYGDFANTSSWAVSSSWADSARSSSYSQFAKSASWTAAGASSSYSDTASVAISASWAPYVDTGTTLATASTYQITSSWSENSKSASYLNPGANLYLSQSWIDSNTSSVSPAWTPGRMWWDKVNHTYAIYNDNSSVALQIGQEQFIRAVAGEDIADGKIVYISSSIQDHDNPTNNLPVVWKAIADGTGVKSKVVGMTTHTFSSGSTGWVTVNGIVNDVDTSGFIGGNVVWLSSVTPGEMTQTEPGQPYETIKVGYCIFENVSTGKVLVDVTPYAAPSLAYAGMTNEPIITNNNDGTISITTGSVNLYDTATGQGVVRGLFVPAITMSVITGSTNYIVVPHSGSTLTAANYQLTTDEFYANGINIVRVSTLDINYKGPGDWDIHKFDVGIVGLALANRLNNKDIRLNGYERETGLSLSETGSQNVSITAGNVWYGPNSHAVDEFNSQNSASGYYLYVFYHTGSNTWHQDTSSVYLSNYYDDGIDIQPLAPLSYSVNYIYRLLGTTDEAALVLGNSQYANLADAQFSQPPSGLPSTIQDIGLLVGRIIAQSGSTTATVVESAFTTVFGASQPTQHNNLDGLQGGTGGEYYHMSLADYTGTGTGLMVRATHPTMSSPHFLGATQYHIPYWKNGELTLTGSVQVANDRSVLINSASFPDGDNPEALLVRQLITSSVNTIGAYSNVDDFSQIYNQNFSNGTQSSTDIVATSNVGGQTSSYIDVGIAGSNYNDARWPWTKPLDSYIECDGGDLWVAAMTDGKKIRFLISNSVEVGYFDADGFHASGSLLGTSSYSLASGFSNTASWASASLSASWSDRTLSSSYTTKSSNADTSSYVATVNSASFASFSDSSSFAVNSQNSNTASYVATVNSASYGDFSKSSSYSAFADSSSFSTNAISSSYSSTSSVAISSSWAQFTPSASFSLLTISGSYSDFAKSASYGGFSNSASFSSMTISSSYALSSSYADTASLAITSSFSMGVPTIKAGIVSGSTFAGTPRTSSLISFSKPFPNNNYVVQVTGENARTWLVQNKTNSGFRINSNSSTVMSGSVFWKAMSVGEFY